MAKKILRVEKGGVGVSVSVDAFSKSLPPYIIASDYCVAEALAPNDISQECSARLQLCNY